MSDGVQGIMLGPCALQCMQETVIAAPAAAVTAHKTLHLLGSRVGAGQHAAAFASSSMQQHSAAPVKGSTAQLSSA
jgi:hypothetical protein